MGLHKKLGRYFFQKKRIYILYFKLSVLQEGSMDSIYEPIPQQAKQESTCSRSEETGQAQDKLFQVSEVSPWMGFFSII